MNENEQRDIIRRSKIMTGMYLGTCIFVAVSAVLNLLIYLGTLPYDPTFSISFSLALIVAALTNGYSFYSRKKGGGYATSAVLRVVCLSLMVLWIVSMVLIFFL